MGACREKGVPNRGGQLRRISFYYLRGWHDAFASSISDQVRKSGSWSALVAAEQATDSIKNNMRAFAVLMGPSPFVFNEQELPW